MKIKVTAVTSFTHGPLSTHVGQEFELTKVEAAELVGAGLVMIGAAPDPELEIEPEPETNLVSEPAPASALPSTPEPAPSLDSAAPPVDNEASKMADEPKNKMADAPMNKASKSKAK